MYLVSLIRVLFFCLSLLILIPFHMQPMLVGIFFVLSVYVAFVHKLKFEILQNRRLLVGLIPFLIFLASYLIQLDSSNLKFLVRALPLLLLVVSFFIFNNLGLLTLKSLGIFKKGFVCGSLVFIIVSVFNFYFNHMDWWVSILDADSLRNSIRYIPFLDLHPLYASLYMSVSLICSINLYLENKKQIYLLFGILIGAFIFLLSSKITLLSLVFILLYKAFIYMIRKASGWRSIIIILLGLSIIGYLISSNGRIEKMLDKDVYLGRTNNLNSTSIRVALYKSSWDIIQEEWMFGVGFGKTKELVSEKFVNKYNGSGEYNTHNQFISVFIALGLLGFFFFVYFFWFNLKMAVSNLNIIYVDSLILIIMGLLVENFLERQFGIILIAYIIGYLGLTNNNLNTITK